PCQRPAVKSLTLCYSPCPNDTFVFTAWAEGRIGGAPPVGVRLDDNETLNPPPAGRGPGGRQNSFPPPGPPGGPIAPLHSGGALGRGCGPLVVARESLQPDALAQRSVAIPGVRTTAALLLRLFAPDVADVRSMPFHEIMPAVADGAVDAGVIIHESRF